MSPIDEGREVPGGGYRFITSEEGLSEDFIHEYWTTVRRALREVFNFDDQSADIAIGEVKAKLNSQMRITGKPQTLFYHADPFEVAADLAGRRAETITPEEKRRYVGILASSDTPRDSDIDLTHPEDP